MMCFGFKDRKRLKTNHCVIVLLDDTQLVHELHPTSTGQDLLDVVIKHLNLLETSYFGLKYYQETNGQTCNSSGAYSSQYSADGTLEAGQRQRQPVWLDVERSAIKQLREVNPMTVYFGVKYYATDPCKLAEEITRYQFFLQCKQDILNGRLPVSFDLTIELFGLAIQSELGDYDPARHQENYATEFQFVAHQTLELEQRACLYHRQLVGQVPATAELNFLEKVKWLDLYGCQLHPIQYDDGQRGDQYALGLNPTGVLVLRNKLKVAQYLWSRIVKTKCQGRCFLMDVIDNQGEVNGSEAQLGSGAGALLLTTTAPQSGGKTNHTQVHSLNLSSAVAAAAAASKRNRLGFRLVDKEASRRLRWALEEYKHFYHLIHSTTSLNQLARQQRQQQALAMSAASEQLKLSQRFRNSIRSAINLGAQSSFMAHQQQQREQQQQQQQQLAIQQQLAFQQQQAQRLRSSIKSLNHHTQLASRQPPTVIRTPSRRYSNRSLPRAGATNGSSQQQAYRQFTNQANGNGLPPVVGMSHTLRAGQRQQAMLMVQQQQQQQQQQPQFALAQPPAHLPPASLGSHHHHSFSSKSHTLKPVSSREAKQRGHQANQYYHQMMLMMAAQQQQRHLNAKANQLPEVSILPPGQHIVQPSIYKATSVVDGINQLADIKCAQQQQQQQQFKPTTSMMQQFFNTRPQQPQAHRSGHESPRSTKSAMAPSSALKMASKKLARQQQQLLYGSSLRHQAPDERPLLAYADPANSLLMPTDVEALYSNAPPNADYYSLAAASNAMGPYSANASPRSARSARGLSSKHRSKSTGENLNMIHQQQRPTFMSPNKQQLGNTNKMLLATAMPSPPPTHILPPPDYNSSGGTPPNMTTMNNSKRSHKSQQQQHQARRRNSNEDEDDYYCSRSDCSSIEERFNGSSSADARGKARQARFINGQLVNGAGQHQSRTMHQKQPGDSNQKLTDWQAIRRRHDEFSSGKGPLGEVNSMVSSTTTTARERNNSSADSNNNNPGSHVSLKNITNKQATPILLTMGQHLNGNSQVDGVKSGQNANSKAVQLLNMQRQQLNTSSGGPASQQLMVNSTATNEGSPAARLGTHSASGTDSLESSVASSPKSPAVVDHQTRPRGHHNAADSTTSNSTTTSGYYAGSNSTGPASVDSDSISAECGANSATGTVNQVDKLCRPHQRHTGDLSEGPRAKIGLQVHSSNARGTVANAERAEEQTRARDHQERSFYLDDLSSSKQDANSIRQRTLANLQHHQRQQWSQLEQLQQSNGPSSLKYVSFDV